MAETVDVKDEGASRLRIHSDLLLYIRKSPFNESQHLSKKPANGKRHREVNA